MAPILHIALSLRSSRAGRRRYCREGLGRRRFLLDHGTMQAAPVGSLARAAEEALALSEHCTEFVLELRKV